MTVIIQLEKMSDDVARGVDLLNRERPDWREFVSLDRLDMSDDVSCVLAQVFESTYEAGREFLFGEVAGDFAEVIEQAERYGFFLRGAPAMSDDPRYGALTDLWREAARF